MKLVNDLHAVPRLRMHGVNLYSPRIKLILKKIGYKGLEWTQLIQGIVQW
jgi:hypothetical protein